MQNLRELLDRFKRALGKERIPDLLEPINEVLYKFYSDILYTAPSPFWPVLLRTWVAVLGEVDASVVPSIHFCPQNEALVGHEKH